MGSEKKKGNTKDVREDDHRKNLGVVYGHSRDADADVVEHQR
jgi:hypothetical protein